jgi:hypothetical protein
MWDSASSKIYIKSTKYHFRVIPMAKYSWNIRESDKEAQGMYSSPIWVLPSFIPNNSPSFIQRFDHEKFQIHTTLPHDPNI